MGGRTTHTDGGNMINLSPATRIFVALAPVDMRQGFNGLSNPVQGVLGQDPFQGHLYVFSNVGSKPDAPGLPLTLNYRWKAAGKHRLHCSSNSPRPTRSWVEGIRKVSFSTAAQSLASDSISKARAARISTPKGTLVRAAR